MLDIKLIALLLHHAVRNTLHLFIRRPIITDRSFIILWINIKKY